MRVRLFIAFLVVLVLSLAGRTLVLADSGDVPLEKQAPLPVGTVITTQNWRQYKDYMSLGMQILFEGQYAYKLAPDQEVVVGPPTKVVLPREYVKNTEKYSSQVGLKVLPDGGTLIQNYTAGAPFPYLTEPNLGDKILWNLWYRYTPRVEVNHADQTVLIDKYHQAFNQLLFATYMRLGHVSEPGVPIYDPITPSTDYAIYAEVTQPEQSKYTVSLLIYFLDPTRLQENWSFLPSLRRPLRLSATARCSPAVGTDGTTEEQRGGFNLLVSEVTAQVINHKMTLMMNNLGPQYPAPINFFDPNTVQQWGIDQGVAWPPAPSKWELEETYIVDVKRVPSKLAGYCYGNRRINIDAIDYHMSGEELSDMGGKLWKIFFQNQREHPNGYGDLYETGATDYLANVTDLQ